MRDEGEFHRIEMINAGLQFPGRLAVFPNAAVVGIAVLAICNGGKRESCLPSLGPKSGLKNRKECE